MTRDPRKIRREVICEKKHVAIHFKTVGVQSRICDYCEEESFMLLPEIISDIIPINIREIFRRVEAEKVHFAEIKERQILVCVRSLLKPDEMRILERKNLNPYKE